MLRALAKRLRAYAEKDGRGYPDWAVRYVPVVKRIRARHELAGTVLEIGANQNGFARFARRRTIICDIAVEHLKAARATQDVLPVRADIGALPFRSEGFQTLVCMDTFEHLSDATRKAAAREITRVLAADGAAVIGFPAGDAVARAEQEIQDAYQRFCGRRIIWLEEHREQGLPDAGAMLHTFEDEVGSNRRVVMGKNTSLRMWRAMWRILMCGWPGPGNALFQALLRLFTPVLCRIHFGVCYRTLIWLEPRE
ncbi:MAG: class I SAM-dependent methyltransferase [Candidatus Hydrogenedentales bacterium]